MDLLNALVVLTNFVIIPGIAYGSTLALGALGITLIYGILRFSNFAHGDTMAFGGMIAVLGTWWLQSRNISIAPFPTALLVIPFAIAIMIIFLLFCDRTIYRYYRRVKASPIIFVMASLGITFIMNGLVRFIIGPGERRFADGTRFLISARDFKAITGLSEGLAIRLSQVITFISAVVIVAVLFWFLNKTRTGKSMRAFSDNEDLALLSGINPEKVVTIVWVLVAILATVSGTLYGLDKTYKPFTYFMLLLPMFAAAIVGGLGSPIGAIAGGFVIAFSEIFVTYAFKKFFGYLVPKEILPSGIMQLISTDYKFAVSFTILVLVLLFRPTGIFKGRSI